ncbi:hypothetical protein [Coraliomargarita parva]|uniref:hypothetical protein n=1 Tax=Coraliomargarita parva TaxID=3014050 RepID=UPI0022B2BDA5|nr:hypothetical protein [Coraliomargarita parva]
MPHHAVLIFITVIACSGLWSKAYAKDLPQRDPWLWPFASNSIWNMPIGSEAVYVPANLPAPKHIGCDLEIYAKTNAGDPVVPVYSPTSWGQRWPGDRKLGELRIPADLLIADADPPHTPNACTVILMPDGRTIQQLEPACRPTPDARIVGWLHPNKEDLYGQGITGTHYGSGLSALGGSIRRGELLSNFPLRHALKINLWAQYLHYSIAVPGFRWPADRSDSYAPDRYHGENPQLVMGTLLALPPELKPEQLEVESEVGLKIFHALQDYGAYVADDTAWDASDLCVEKGVPNEVQAKYGYSLVGSDGILVNEMSRMVTALMLVANNSPQSIGGGGQPRQALAPALTEPMRSTSPETPPVDPYR